MLKKQSLPSRKERGVLCRSLLIWTWQGPLLACSPTMREKMILSHSHKFCMLDTFQIVNKLECVHFFGFGFESDGYPWNIFIPLKCCKKTNKNRENKWVKSFPSSVSFRNRGYCFPPWELLRLTKTRKATWLWLDIMAYTASSILYRIGHLKHCAFKCACGVVALHYCPPVCSS